MGLVVGLRCRGSAKSGQVVDWVMSLMARFGCRDRDLVMEAIAAWAPWARRMRPGGQVAQGGHYVLTVKGNQKTLRRTLKNLPWKKAPSVSSIDTGHGRRVRRTARGRPGTQVGGLPRSGSGYPGPTYQDHQGQKAR